ncbi:hypothetical protein SAMN04487761_1285 [Lachnospiraceae bacterium C7]|nr:hypothetical protein SAMN04487761_1285 [Lachnospiraceae bacterium C7]
MFSVFTFVTSFDSLFIHNSVVSEEVTIIDKRPSLKRRSAYAYVYTAENEKGTYYLHKCKYEVGSHITIYQNPSSLSANSSSPEWFDSEADVKQASKIYFFMSIAFLIVSIFGLYVMHKNKKQKIKKKL